MDKPEEERAGEKVRGGREKDKDGAR